MTTIIGHGIDLVEVAEIERVLESPDANYAARCFTARERADAGDGPHRAERLAGRFAAKEAVLKALGTGWSHGIAWTDVEIEALPSGAPAVRLHGRAAAIADALAIVAWRLSISHTAVYATASVIAVGHPSGDRTVLDPSPHATS